LNEPNRLVIINSSGEEETISFLGILSSELSFCNGKIYWTEQIPSLRWEQESFSDLIEYDIKSGKIRRLTNGLSVSNPVVSASGQTIIAAEYPVALPTLFFLILKLATSLRDSGPLLMARLKSLFKLGR